MARLLTVRLPTDARHKMVVVSATRNNTTDVLARDTLPMFEAIRLPKLACGNEFTIAPTASTYWIARRCWSSAITSPIGRAINSNILSTRNDWAAVSVSLIRIYLSVSGKRPRKQCNDCTVNYYNPFKCRKTPSLRHHSWAPYHIWAYATIVICYLKFIPDPPVIIGLLSPCVSFLMG